MRQKKKKLEKSLKSLQEAEECRQRRKRKNNIIIKSKSLASDLGTGTENKAREILKTIDCKEEFTWATYVGNDMLGKGMIKVQLNNLKDKINIMKNKQTAWRRHIHRKRYDKNRKRNTEDPKITCERRKSKRKYSEGRLSKDQ